MAFRKKLGKFVESKIQALTGCEQTTHPEKVSKRDFGRKIKIKHNTDLKRFSWAGTSLATDTKINTTKTPSLLDASKTITCNAFTETQENVVRNEPHRAWRKIPKVQHDTFTKMSKEQPGTFTKMSKEQPGAFTKMSKEQPDTFTKMHKERPDTFTKMPNEQHCVFPKRSRDNSQKTIGEAEQSESADENKSDQTSLLRSTGEPIYYNTIPKSVKRQTTNDEWPRSGRFSLAQGNATTSDYESGDTKLFAAEDDNQLKDENSSTPSFRTPETEETPRPVEHWKSAPNLDLNDEEPEDCKSICIFNGHVSQSIINLGNTGKPTGGARISVGSSEQSDLQRRVEEQTRTAIASLPEEWVHTEGYDAADRMTREMPLHMAMITGDGDGTTFTALAMLRENTKDGVAKPYLIINPKEWTCVDTSEKAVVFLPDITGTTHFDPIKAEKTITLIEQNILPYTRNNGNVTLIVTMKQFQKQNSYITTHYGEYLIDLQSNVHRISDETKTELVIHFMKKHGVKVCQIKLEETIAKKREDNGHIVLMSKQTVKDIIYLSETNGFVRKLNMYFTFNLCRGADYFTKPRKDLVQEIRELPERTMLSLVGVFAEGGELSRSRMSELRGVGRKSMPDRLHKAHKSSRQMFKQRVDTRKNAILFKYARMNGLMGNMADILEQNCQKLDGTLLQQDEDIFRFAGAAVENSFLVVLSEILPIEVLSTCSIDFLHKYVGVFQAFSDEEDELYVNLTSTQKEHLWTIMTRMKDGIFLKKVKDVCSHSLLRESWFAETFLTFLRQEKLKSNQWFKKDKKLIQSTLTRVDDCTEDEYCMLYFGVEVMFRCPKPGKPANLCEMILREGTWEQIRKKKKRREWTNSQEHETLRHAVELSNETTVKELVLLGAPITIDILLVAIRTGRMSIVTTILQQGKFTHNEWRSAIHYALKTEPDSVKENIFDIVATEALSHFEGHAITEMMLVAAQHNDKHMFHQLLKMDERLSIDINLMSSDDETPLVIAVKNSYVEFVQLLLQAEADQSMAGVKELPIHIAVKVGCAPILTALLNDKPNIICERDSDGLQPLHLAVKHGKVDCVDILLQRKAMIDATDSNLQTPLHLAVEGGHSLLVGMLIKHKADTHLMDKQMNTPLSLACRLGKYSCVEIFLQSDFYKKEKEALLQAVIAGSVDVVKLLLTYEYDVNQPDIMHGSPLFAAIENDRHDMATFLIRNGADVMAQHKGHFPLHEACARGDSRLMDLLLSCGVNITTKQQTNGNNVIHIAVSHNQPDMIKHIFARDDSDSLVNMRNKKGETALHVACSVANVAIVEVLLKVGFSKNRTSWASGISETPLSIAKHLERKNRENKHACRKIISLLRESS